MAVRKELTVTEWFTEIKSGLEFRKLYGREDSWTELEALFYEAVSGIESRGPNLIASIGDSTVSQLTTPYPYIMVRARRRELVQNARLLEAVDNLLIDELGLVGEIETSVLHAFLWGRGFLKIGYDSEFGWNPADLSEIEAVLGLSGSQFDRRGNRLEYSGRVKPGMPWVSAVLPHDIIVPWGCRLLGDSPYVVHRVVRHIDDIKADSKYSNTKRLQPVMTAKEAVEAYLSPTNASRLVLPSSAMTDVESEYCELFEIHDGRTGRVKVVATGHDEFLRDDVDYLQLEGLPFVSFSLVPVARNFWTTSDAYYLRSYQEELNDISLQGARHRRLQNLKFLYTEDTIEAAELDKLFSSETGPGVKVKAGTPLSEAVYSFVPGSPNVNIFSVDSEYVRRNARETVGFSRNQLGEYEHRGRRTASEVMAVREGASTKLSRRQLVIQRAYIELIKKVNAIIFKHWTTPRWVQVGGDWSSVTGPMLAGDYGYDLMFAQRDPVGSPEGRAMENLQLYNVLAADPFVDQEKLREIIQSSMPNPEFRAVFKNANLPVQMSGMQQGSRGAGEGRGEGQAEMS